MKTPLWETSSGALVALLNSGAPIDKADLYTLTLSGGAVYRWSGADVAVTGNGSTWVLGPGLQRAGVRFVTGVEVDTLTITITDIRGTLINGVPLITFIAAGGLDGARLQLDRAYWTVGDTAARGALLWFAGAVSEIPEIDRYGAQQITVQSDLSALNVQVPRDVFQAGCLNTVYDARCGAVRSPVTAAVTSVSNAAAFAAGGLAQVADYFSLGKLTFTSGKNAGLARTVRQHATGGVLTMMTPFPFVPAVGDTVAVLAGCDGTQTGTNGCPKFHAAADVKRRFRGQPYIPAAETVT